MNDEQVETTVTEQAQTPASTLPHPVKDGTGVGTSAVPATPKILTEADVQAAVAKAQREGQAAKDRELAKVHAQYQSQLRATKQAAKQAIGEEGEGWEQSLDVWQKAQAYDQLSGEQAAVQQWQGYVSASAEQAGLAPDDPRLANATDATDLTAKIVKAVREDERKAVADADKKAKDAEQAALQAKVDSGALDVLGGSPAPGGGTPSEQKYRQEMLAARGKGRDAIFAIKDKYRKQGLDVDSIPLLKS